VDEYQQDVFKQQSSSSIEGLTRMASVEFLGEFPIGIFCRVNEEGEF